MNSLVQAMTEKDAYTENGALTNSTSHDYNLDLFFLAGACREVSNETLEQVLVKSYAFNRERTLKIIYWAADIRQGAGERRFFKVALNWLYKNHREDVYQYLNYDPEFSRWDVLFQFDDDKIVSYVAENCKQGNTLLCKWLPRRVSKKDVYKRYLWHDISLKGHVESVDGLTGYNKYDAVMVGNQLYCYIDKWVKLFEEKKDDKTVYFYKHEKRRFVKDKYAQLIINKLGWSDKQYKRHLAKHTKVVETLMCDKKWNEIDYSKVPSVALNKYNKAWYRNDKERFEAYLESVKKGECKINAGAIFPHDIIRQALTRCGQWDYDFDNLNEAQIIQWNNLPNYMEGHKGSILPICDTSGSMGSNKGLPICISLALGLYISERNEGIFKDAFITFSAEPKMHYLKGDINDRMQQLINSTESMNTDLEAVFKLILDKAIKNHIAEEEMPRTLLIISDMEFDKGTTGTETTHEVIEKMYAARGYRCPNLIYWNVNGRAGNVPITTNTYGAALISGASPSILKALFTDNINPVKMMTDVIETERYSFIK